MKNMNFNFEHEKLGQLIAIISSGEAVTHTTNVIPATILIQNKNMDTIPFLFKLYTEFGTKNDLLATLIGDYLELKKINLSNEQIVADINAKYSKITQNKKKKQDLPLVKNDGVLVQIINSNNSNEQLYNAQITIREEGGQLQAHIDEQKVLKKFQKNGLTTKMLTEILPIYCASNNLSAITLEAGAIDGVDKATLEKIYTALGFEQQGDLFIRPVTIEQSSFMDENDTYVM